VVGRSVGLNTPAKVYAITRLRNATRGTRI
jgi:hypothetical protein